MHACKYPLGGGSTLVSIPLHTESDDDDAPTERKEEPPTATPIPAKPPADAEVTTTTSSGEWSYSIRIYFRNFLKIPISLH